MCVHVNVCVHVCMYVYDCVYVLISTSDDSRVVVHLYRFLCSVNWITIDSQLYYLTALQQEESQFIKTRETDVVCTAKLLY